MTYELGRAQPDSPFVKQHPVETSKRAATIGVLVSTLRVVLLVSR